MNLWILGLTVMLSGCGLMYPSAVCHENYMYVRQGVTSVYTPTEMRCIDAKE